MKYCFDSNQMKNKTNRMKNFKSKWIGLSLVALTILSSCQSEFDKVIPAAPPLGSNLQYKTPKVLYIIADGARGTSVRDADVPTLKSLITNSIYKKGKLQIVFQSQ